VAKLATIIVGLRWDAPNFKQNLLNIIPKWNINIVVPCMDGATVALSQIASDLQSLGCWPLVASAELCITFEDKRLAEKWFVDHCLRTPVWSPDSPLPWIIKHIHGFASRRQFKVNNLEEFHSLESRIDLQEYLIQPFIDGPEFTIDAYISRSGEVLGCVTRRRLHVVDGEVVKSVTERNEPLIEESTKILNCGDFQGPITIQAIQHEGEFWFIEINPRFGGGVILSFEAGADYAWLLVREAIGRPVSPVSWREGILMTRAYREVFFDGVEYGPHI
jgi:carbamoyl-phosphate synthase large subunit